MKALVIGATSAIAEAVTRILASRHAEFFLVARDPVRARAIATDLEVRGAAKTHFAQMDVNDFQNHEPMFEEAVQTLGSLDIVLIAHGTLGDQRACETSTEMMIREISTNGLSVVALASRAATLLARQHHGSLVVISSVAGDRGRQSNYVYGSAKALVTAFLSGLRQRLHGSGVNVITVKPGPVDTPMTAALPKGLLWSTPGNVAKGIVRAIDRRSAVVYLPRFWRPIMLVIRLIPERAFRRLAL